MADRYSAHIDARPQELSGGDLGHRRSSHHLRPRTAAMRGYLHLLFARRSRSVAGTDERFPHFRKIRRNYATGRQRLRTSAAENRRMLGADSSAHDDPRFTHVDFLLARPALLG